jgi:hypothetical protein
LKFIFLFYFAFQTLIIFVYIFQIPYSKKNHLIAFPFTNADKKNDLNFDHLKAIFKFFIKSEKNNSL